MADGIVCAPPEYLLVPHAMDASTHTTTNNPTIFAILDLSKMHLLTIMEELSFSQTNCYKLC